jgi:hypothetical protein
MDHLTQYQNLDGTFTSPKNGKTYKSIKAFRAHWHCRPDTGGWSAINYSKLPCKHCNKQYSLANVTTHEKSCYLNPSVLQTCNYCGKPIKNYQTSKGTCSKSCANSFFKVGINNGNFKGDSYQYLCFSNHEKKCVVCGEDNIVAVHHMNLDHNDNSVENLIPLCPTHHQYMHSKHKNKILHLVEEYIRSRITLDK